MLGEASTYGINASFGSPEQKLISILLKQMQNCVWVYIIMLMIVIYLLMEKKS